MGQPTSIHQESRSVLCARLRLDDFDAVRRELLGGSRERTVSETAVRWGFLQLGYFAMSYRCMFGESPRETLQRGRDARGFHSRGPRSGSAVRS